MLPASFVALSGRKGRRKTSRRGGSSAHSHSYVAAALSARLRDSTAGHVGWLAWLQKAGSVLAPSPFPYSYPLNGDDGAYPLNGDDGAAPGVERGSNGRTPTGQADHRRS